MATLLSVDEFAMRRRNTPRSNRAAERHEGEGEAEESHDGQLPADDEDLDEEETDSEDEGSQDVESEDEEDEEEEEGEIDGGKEHKDEEVSREELTQKLTEIDATLSNADADKIHPEAFIREYGKYVGLKPPPNMRNVLHMMAGNTPTHPWLVKYLVKNHPRLMVDMDDADRRALYIAIKWKKEDFIKAVLESEYPDMADILDKDGNSTSSESCIHLAIKQDLDPKITVQLIEKASELTLAAQDGSGLTPLHCAVNYAKCTDSQLQVVKALMKYGDLALDKFSNKPELYSVYRYHLSSHAIAERDALEKAAQKTPVKEKRRRRVAASVPADEEARPGGSTKGDSQSKESKKPDDEPKTIVEDAKEKKKNIEDIREKLKNTEGAKDKAKIPGVPLSRLIHSLPARTGKDPPSPSPLRRSSTAIGPDGQTLAAMPVMGSLSNNSAVSPTYTANETKFRAPTHTATPRTVHDMGPPPHLVPLPQESAKTAKKTSAKSISSTKTGLKGSKSGKKQSSAGSVSGAQKEVVTKESADAIAKELKLQYLRTTFKHVNRPGEIGPRLRRNEDSAVKFLYGNNEKSEQSPSRPHGSD
jgi:hypothetical protein